jgi:hypothetical protein
MEVLIEGKVLRARRYQASQFFTAVATPAPDPYSRPQIVEIRSKSRFAEPDQAIKVRCKLGGYEGRQYRVTDKDTGETRMAQPVSLTLDLVE